MKGIKISTTNSGVKYKGRDDLLLVAFENEANVAGLFTQSTMPAAPVIWCKKNISKGVASALVANAGNANAFTGVEGEITVTKTVEKVAEILNCQKEAVFVSSTGVIGEVLDANLMVSAISEMSKNFSSDETAFVKAAKSIMTTDSREKIVTKNCNINGEKITLTGFVKGSGMIAPNMATMLSYIFTDANISSSALQILLKESNEKSFNSITVDSDQSTNDTVLLFATKAVGDDEIQDPHSENLTEFKNTLDELMLELAKKLVIDGEGAKKLIEIEVLGATTKFQAKRIALSVANSPLVKTAVAGCDPNWGRIIMAVGKAESEEATPEKIIIKIGDYILTKDGAKHPDYVEEEVHQYLKNNEVKISINLQAGTEKSVVWTCDLNEEYIKINKDYRS